MLMPGVVAGALFTFLVSTNIFLLTFFLGQGKIITLPTLLFSKISGGTIDASAAGITLIVTLPGIILLSSPSASSRKKPSARASEAERRPHDRPATRARSLSPASTRR